MVSATTSRATGRAAIDAALIRNLAQAQRKNQQAAREVAKYTRNSIQYLKKFTRSASTVDVQDLYREYENVKSLSKEAEDLLYEFKTLDPTDPLAQELHAFIDALAAEEKVYLATLKDRMVDYTKLSTNTAAFVKSARREGLVAMASAPNVNRKGANPGMPSGSTTTSNIVRTANQARTAQNFGYQRRGGQYFAFNPRAQASAARAMPRSPSNTAAGLNKTDPQQLQMDRQYLNLTRQAMIRDREFQEWQMDFWKKFQDELMRNLTAATAVQAKNESGSSALSLLELLGLGGLKKAPKVPPKVPGKSAPKSVPKTGGKFKMPKGIGKFKLPNLGILSKLGRFAGPATTGISAGLGAFYTENMLGMTSGSASIADRVLTGVENIPGSVGDIGQSIVAGLTSGTSRSGLGVRAFHKVIDTMTDSERVKLADKIVNKLAAGGTVSASELGKDPSFLNLIGRRALSMADKNSIRSSFRSFMPDSWVYDPDMYPDKLKNIMKDPKFSAFVYTGDNGDQFSEITGKLADNIVSVIDGYAQGKLSSISIGTPQELDAFVAEFNDFKKQGTAKLAPGSLGVHDPGYGIPGFAKGTVINDPTMLMSGQGIYGQMAEAGPEAIMPLSRGPNGELGIRSFGASRSLKPEITVAPESLKLLLDKASARELGEGIAEESNLDGILADLTNNMAAVAGSMTGTYQEVAAKVLTSMGLDPKDFGLNNSPYPTANAVNNPAVSAAKAEVATQQARVAEAQKSVASAVTVQDKIAANQQLRVAQSGLKAAQNKEAVANFSGPNSTSATIPGASGILPSGLSPGSATGASSALKDAKGRVISTANTSLPPEQRAFLDTLAMGNATSGGNYWESPDYNTIVGGKKFDGYADHPRVFGTPNSTAAGRYQFTKTTWDDVVKRYNATNPNSPITDFSPQNQDRAALFLAQSDYKRRTGGRDLMADLKSGDPNVGNLIKQGLGGVGANTTWEILQRKSGEDIKSAYDANLARNNSYASASPANVSIASVKPAGDIAAADGVFAGVTPTSSAVGVDAAAPNLKMTNQNATRNKALTEQLQAQLQQTVAQVYGPGYSAEVYSGGQDVKGKGNRRTGSTRHDGGMAADLYIKGPDGKKVTGEQLAKLGQAWLAQGNGGVGLEMNGGGIHLDQHKDRAKNWWYNGGPASPKIAEMIEAGKKGVAPEYAMSAEDAKNYAKGVQVTMASVNEKYAGNPFGVPEGGVKSETTQSTLEPYKGSRKSIDMVSATDDYESAIGPRSKTISMVGAGDDEAAFARAAYARAQQEKGSERMAYDPNRYSPRGGDSMVARQETTPAPAPASNASSGTQNPVNKQAGPGGDYSNIPLMITDNGLLPIVTGVL